MEVVDVDDVLVLEFRQALRLALEPRDDVFSAAATLERLDQRGATQRS